MKISTLLTAACLTACLIPGCCLAGEPIIFNASRVKIFIADIQFSDRYAAAAGILASKGYIPSWPDAVAATFKAKDAQGIIQNLKIFAIPFANSRGKIATSIIGGIIQSPDGGQIDEFISTVAIPIHESPIHATPVSAWANKAIPKETNIAPIIRSFNAGNRADIWAYIIRDITPKVADPGIAIKAAFENNGYSCSIAPDWFPQKSIWYAATCMSKAQ
jgi:hypothetical protein